MPDAAYRGELEDWLYLAHQCQLEIASTLGQQGFEVVPLRWIVERTFSWLGWFRPLTLDYERYPKTAQTMVYIASIYLMRNRIKLLFKQALRISVHFVKCNPNLLLVFSDVYSEEIVCPFHLSFTGNFPPKMPIPQTIAISCSN